MPGYSAKSLVQKLGIKPDSRVFLAGAPKGYVGLLEPLPAGVSFAKRVSKEVDLAHVFVTTAADLSNSFGFAEGLAQTRGRSLGVLAKEVIQSTDRADR
jgi:hypothetical protein